MMSTILAATHEDVQARNDRTAPGNIRNFIVELAVPAGTGFAALIIDNDLWFGA
jgi:hypothetical protein